MKSFEDEVDKLRSYQGSNKKKNPVKWIKWETQFKTPTGTRAPPWREIEGDLGYVIVSTHDEGIIVLLCREDGKCMKIKGYYVAKDGSTELNYDTDGPECESITEVLEKSSGVFKEVWSKIEDESSEDDPFVLSRDVLDNELISLPQPVLVITPPIIGNDEEQMEEMENEDDEKIIPYPRGVPTDGDYWNIFPKMQNFARNPSDPSITDLQDVSTNPNLKEVFGQRAVLNAGALPVMFDVLRIKQAQHTIDNFQTKQAEAVLRVLAAITISPNIRRLISTDDYVKILLLILKKEERPLMEDLFTTIANCCHNTKFRDLIIKHEGVEPLIYQLRHNDLAPQICYLLWSLNRSEQATTVLLKCHLINEIQKYIVLPAEKTNDELVLNLTRLLYSIAQYDKKTSNDLSREQIIFFSQGLSSTKPALVEWSARAFTIFEISDELQKPFIQSETPQKLIRTLDSKHDDVVLAGLESIAVVGKIEKIREDIVDGILPKLQNLWNSENPTIRKGTLRVIGVLTAHTKCSKWTVKQNIIPDLVNYLHSTDPDFVVYAATAIGSCCIEKDNLNKLQQLNGIRILWSLMKSPFNKVQAEATKALVPFLRSEGAPAIVRSFVDGLDLIVNLLHSNDPEVQAAACMAISEIARDQENLAVMTDLGLVELLSRLLSSNHDFVRKPLADAIGVSANWGNNRRRFGEEGAVDPLVSYLRPPSMNKDVHAATAKALKALSEDEENSEKLRYAGVVDYLLIMVASPDPNLQMAAAVAIRNIRTNCVRIE